jgi:peptide subunit release factor 1 (eRF1)
MSIPSFSVSVHDRYTPEMRDRILEKLQASVSEVDDTAYRMLTPARLRALAEIDSADAPVLSLYLQLTPERRTGRAWRTFFASLSDATLKPIGNRHEREAVKEEFDRIERAMEAELPALGRGVVFFACRKIGLWHQIAVSVPLPDGAHLSPRPYVRPLVRTRDEHDRFVLALLRQQFSRFFISQIGQVEEVFQVKGDDLRDMLTDRVPRDRLDVLITEAMKNEAHVLAHAAELVLGQFEGRHLLLSGAPEVRAAVTPVLPKDVQQRIGGEFPADIHARPSDIAAAAEPAQRAVEEREETATAQRLLDAGPKGSAWGVQPVLDAVREGRVLTLVADDTLAKPGMRCRECGALSEARSPNCPVCGSNAVEDVEDVVELAIERTLEEKGAFELVRSPPARQLLSRIGPMAALLRW